MRGRERDFLWHPRGRLIEVIGEIGTQKLGIARDARICEVFRERVWRIRNCRDQHIREVIQGITCLPLSLSDSEPDAVSWKCGEGDYRERFIASETWHQLRGRKEEVRWSKLLWFPQNVPRYAFITWLAIKDRLATGSRTRQWGQAQICVYCGEPDETRDHLFFACPYTFTLWLQVVGNLFGSAPDPDWEITLQRLINGNFDRLTFILLRLVLQTTIYFIWRERIDRRHNNAAKTVDQLARLIDKTIRNRITSTGYNLKKKLYGLMQRWFSAH
ncbi:uncharacterized protein LOC130502902 [Raphanus sativus]|uniref:Uncharacterized protein LOC130502902 n=1 Tax=Raphanus sativus TaxID=3726 RepID=A0A9W3CQ56_RAPSA|nr:uncharacterized protein LOC130502902 [Raphanus sativus]